MIIQPKVRGFICTTAHPIGCQYRVRKQINFVKEQGTFSGPKNVLVIGSSTGYGEASRIVATFAAGAKTIGVFYEKPASDKRTASAGWYNTAAFETFAHQEGYYAKSINGDAFSNEIKQQTLDLIREDLGQIDLLVYSLASPRRIHPTSGKTYASVLKPIGQSYTNKTVDPMTGEVKLITLEPANEDEIEQTIAVMGGEDWEMWVEALAHENLLSKDFMTVAYSYIGPELTHPIYKNGTIGRAKDHLQATAEKINQTLVDLPGHAYISINKALVTQASAAIPVVPLYMSLLFKIMKENGTHEGCIEQMYRLLAHKMYIRQPIAMDEAGRIRVDDYEMKPEVQKQVEALWEKISTENIDTLTDIKGYRDDFYQLFGFGMEGVDYTADTNPEVDIPSILKEKEEHA